MSQLENALRSFLSEKCCTWLTICRRGGSRRGDRRGWDVSLWHATGGGQGAWETDVGGSGVTDSRVCYVDPACLGRGRDCPPLTQGRRPIAARAVMPPLRKGGTRREPQGGSTWLGGGSVACDRRRSGCVGDGRGGAGVTDSRACYGDPACLGRGRDCPPLAQGRLFFGGKIPRRPGVGPVGAVGVLG